MYLCTAVIITPEGTPELIDAVSVAFTELRLAAEQAEVEECAQAAAEAQGSNPLGSPSQTSHSQDTSGQGIPKIPPGRTGHSQDAPEQQPAAAEQAGPGHKGPQLSTEPEASASPMQSSVKGVGSRSGRASLRFAESPTVATLSGEDNSGSGILTCAPRCLCTCDPLMGMLSRWSLVACQGGCLVQAQCVSSSEVGTAASDSVRVCVCVCLCFRLGPHQVP